MLYETDFEREKTPNIPNQLSDGDTQNQLSDKDTQNQLSYEERRILIDVDEEHWRGESSTHGEIRGALLRSDYSLYKKALRQRKTVESGNEYEPANDDDYYDDMLE